MIKIGIVGSGAMGSGIAQVASTAGHEVIVYDVSEKALKKAESKLASILDRQVEKGRMSGDEISSIQNRINWSSSMEDLAPCGLVIEAIVESIDVKKAVFQKLEALCSEDAILASNTSSLSIAAIGAACEKSERVIGIHFFNPAPLMPLVEIIPSVQTSSNVLLDSKNIIDSWGKKTVIVKDTPGFIVNRVARPFYGEALRIYEEGIADFASIDDAMKTIGGFRMGPFELMDYIGNDVNYVVTETVFQSFYNDPRYKPSFTQKRYSEAGLLGRKSGKGYYDYSEGAEKAISTISKNQGEVIVRRIVMMLINEAADALFWNIASKEDIDLAMQKGVNYPKGLLKWADEFGINIVVSYMDGLYDEYREDRYRCSPLLRRMAKENQRFYS
ncbi:MAG: 3-hydroxybutyryl-CoA dehydrogenase [Patiriisocius sp.]|jgi:3-hydroxybutyryl-CoA dehydrogenase